MPSWIAGHQQELQRVAAKNAAAAAIVGNLSTTPKEVSIVIGARVLMTIGVTACGYWSRRAEWGLKIYSVLLGVLFLHVFSHLGLTLYFGGYTPGVIGAVAALIPASVYVYWRLLSARVVSLVSAVIAAAIGVSLFVPVVMIGHLVGRTLGGR